MQIIQKSVRISIFLSLLQFTACFGLFRAGPEKRSLPAYLLAFLGGGSGGSATASEHTDLSSEPTVALPGSLSQYSVNVATSDQEAPRNAGSHFTAVGQAYDITLAGLDVPEGQHVYFGEEVALSYEYDAAALKAAGLIEDFTVFYYDNQTQSWLPVERTEVDAQSGKVTAYTTHFTTFVLTALPAPAGAPNAAPACIAGDFPAGIGGAGGASFMTVGEGFQYYQDRDYIIDPGNPSFQALGFQGALGISTCNGNSTCGTFAQHKHYEGSTYIQFTAHMVMDVYIMYDDRANPNPGQVPDWFNTAGFSYTGHNIGTTDPGANYNVFKKTYLPGQLVTLGGNRQGSTKKVETNYWVVLKPAGVTAAQPPGAMCIANAPAAAPLSVTNVRAAPGSTVVNLRWELPIDPAFAGVVIRRSQLAPPATVTDGEAPGGSVIAPTAYRDEGLAQGASYFYSVFAVDVAQNVGPRVSTGATTSGDIDGDGLADSYEGTQTYETWFPGSPPPHHTAATNPDSDGDGQSDGMEWLLGSNPTNADGQRPAITRFEAITDTPNYNPTTPIILEGTDNVGITQWMITEAAAAPSATDPRWNTAIPSSYELTATGNHQLYAWARDAAGNVSLPYTPVQIQLDGISVADKLFLVTTNMFSCPNFFDRKIHSYSFQPSGAITHLSEITAPTWPQDLRFHNGNLYSINQNYVFSVGPPCGNWADPGQRIMSTYSIGSGGAVHSHDFNDSPRDMRLGYTRNPEYIAISSFMFPGAYSEFSNFKLYKRNGGGIELKDTISFSIPHIVMNSWIIGRLVLAMTDENDTIPSIRSYRITDTDQLQAVNSKDIPFSISLRASDVAPNARFFYSTYWLITPFIAGAVKIYPIAADGTLADPITQELGDYQIHAFHIASDGMAYMMVRKESNSTHYLKQYRPKFDGTLEEVKSVVLPVPMNDSARIVSDISGQNIVLIYGSNFGYATAARYSAQLELRGTVQTELYQGIPGDISYRHETNLPPQVQMGPERWLHFKPGNPISLNAHGYAFDPDAGQCNVNPANYQIAWEIVSAPPGSGATTVNIANVNSLNGASLIPDIAGDYTVRLTFTDHPGDCQGSAQTASGEVKLKLGYEHFGQKPYPEMVRPEWVYEDIEAVKPDPDANWVDITWRGAPVLRQQLKGSVKLIVHGESGVSETVIATNKLYWDMDYDLWKYLKANCSGLNTPLGNEYGYGKGRIYTYYWSDCGNGYEYSYPQIFDYTLVPVRYGYWRWWDYSPTP